MIGEDDKINNNWDNSIADFNNSKDQLKFEFEE
jgi:hypothetical protein